MLGVGTVLNDRYVLSDRLGGGGMGEVWRADDTVLGRAVAVKVLMPALNENPTFVQRFQNEARAMATLRHPGVVDVYDYGVCDVAGRQVSFLVMEYVPGESLDRVLRRGPLEAAAAMRLVAEVGDALAAAHAQGIVHRDVKPANLMIRPDGSVALTDFGIAHSASAGHLTATGTMLCSAGYCAPEMATSSEVTPAVDVYALGVVAYECLTGQLPFQGDTPVQIIFKHLNAPIPRLPDSVPPGPRQVVSLALAKAPDGRWATMAQMAGAARRAMTAPGTPPVPRRRRTLRVVLTVAAAVLVSVAVAGSVWLRPAQPTTSTSEATPTAGQPAVTASMTTAPARNLATPPPRQSVPATTTSTSAAAEPPRTTHAPRPTATPTTTTAVPTRTPTAEPTTSEPEPTTVEPTPPGPEEPTAEPTIGKPTGGIQCVRAPCP